MNHIKYLLIATFILIMACNTREKCNYVNFDKSGFCVLSNWHVFGPFDYDTLKQKPEATFYNRDFDRLSINEDYFNISDLEILQKEHITNKIKYSFLKEKFITHNLSVLTQDINNKSNIYLATIIKSTKEQDLVLLVDGAASYKLWLNQKMIYQTRNRLYIRKIANNFIPIHLKKGNNILFTKINRESNKHAWGIDAAITTQQVAEKVFKSNYISDFVINPIISDTIKYYTGPLTVDKIEIIGENEIIFPEVHKFNSNTQYVPGLDSLSDGFYDFKLIVKNDTLSEKIYKGNILALYNKLKGEFQLNKLQDHEGKALVERIDFIIRSAGTFPPITSYGNDKDCNILYSNTNLVFWVERFKSFLNKEKNGLMLKAYLSPSDGNIYHFALYTHKKLSLKSKVPLIVIMPYAIMDHSLPSSWYLGNLEQILVDCKLARERNFAICWLFARGPKYNVQTTIEDFNCALNKTKEEFNNIDISKIYLAGDCLGATRALILSEYFPHRIKALSLRSPIPKIEYYKMNIGKIEAIPLYIEHGIYDTEIPIEDMRLFVSAISQQVKDLNYNEIDEGHYGFRKDYRETAFDFFHRID